jgi:hypothetical protein
MAEIQFSEDILPVSVRWKDFRSRLLARYGERVFRDHAESFTGGEPKTVPMVVTTLLLNRRIGLIGFSGEPFVTLQMEARRRAPVDDLLFAGYTNGYYDYIPTIKAASEGGYGAADSNTYVDPGTGAEMLERAVVRLYEMLGKLTDSPEDLKRKSQQGGTNYRCPISATK